jgi:hypothetical protein
LTGTITLDSNGDAVLTKYIVADPSAFPAGSKNFSVLIRRGSLIGPVVLTSNTITINNPGGDYLYATGGNSTSIGSDRYHIFKSSANLVVTRTSSTYSNNSNCLVRAGGGHSKVTNTPFSSKNYNTAGGGGAGGLLDTDLNLSIQTYSITVGNGGFNQYLQGRGGNSSIANTIISIGGGEGSSDLGEIDNRFRLRNGGSGGGSGGLPTNLDGKGVYPGSTYIDAARQGYDGGIGWGISGAVQAGGGGGRSSVGTAGVAGSTGRGGTGYEVNWLPSNICQIYDIGENNTESNVISTSGRGNVFASGGSGFNDVDGVISNVTVANNFWRSGGGGGFYSNSGIITSRGALSNTGGGGVRPYNASHTADGGSGVIVVKYTCNARKLSL